MLKLYSIFHLNLAYSSIEKEHQGRVIEKCYWPLLKLAEELDVPFGIEASGYTLETIYEKDPYWVRKLKILIDKRQCEFIGSGYAQIIGSLVPALVNEWNQKWGLVAYKKLLGTTPHIALINEMAFSAGIIEHYADNGYKAVVMEWNNPRKYHPEWKNEWRYFPQKAAGADGRAMPVIWADSIAFQKFQRYAHGEIDREHYISYLQSHDSGAGRFFSLYANDAEIFDYRPGRYRTEPDLSSGTEWERISALFSALKENNAFHIIKPSDVLKGLKEPQGSHLLKLESAEQPIPVKKQEKYNINRWALTGRDDLGINTKCYSIYHALKSQKSASNRDWKELCYLWSSDFRTHITRKRWNEYVRRLNHFVRKWRVLKDKTSVRTKKSRIKGQHTTRYFHYYADEGRLILETDHLKCILNKLKGMTIDQLWFKDSSSSPLLGTLPHGYYDDISLGADYYSGHFIIEKPGEHKITDLFACAPVIAVAADNLITIQVKAKVGEVVLLKQYYIDCSKPCLEIMSHIKIKRQLATIHPMHITFIPTSFDRKSLFYMTNNGGKRMEIFPIGSCAIHHTQSLSFLISAKQGLGATEGVIIIGDKDKQISVQHDQTASALVPSVCYLPVDMEQYFLRLEYSAQELDETFVETDKEQLLKFHWKITSPRMNSASER